MDFLQGLDLHVLDQAAQLGNREPLLGLASVSSVISALSLILAVTQAQDPPAEATLEATTASHSRPSLGFLTAPVSSTIWCSYEEAYSGILRL